LSRHPWWPCGRQSSGVIWNEPKISWFGHCGFVKQDIKKWLKICSFLWLIWKWKEKGTKILTFPGGDLNPGFLNKFPPKVWILREISSIELGVLRTSGLYRTLKIPNPRGSNCEGSNYSGV
jgi:hypothetical protein